MKPVNSTRGLRLAFSHPAPNFRHRASEILSKANQNSLLFIYAALVIYADIRPVHGLELFKVGHPGPFCLSLFSGPNHWFFDPALFADATLDGITCNFFQITTGLWNEMFSCKNNKMKVQPFNYNVLLGKFQKLKILVSECSFWSIQPSAAIDFSAHFDWSDF